MDPKYLQILYDDVDGRKIFNANYATHCDICGNDIATGEEFFFMGDKQKVCPDCHSQLMEQLEKMMEVAGVERKYSL